MMLNVFVIEDERIMDLSELGNCRSADCKNTSDFSQFTSRNVSIDNNVNIFPRRANIVMVEFKKNLMESLLDEFGDYIYIMEKDNYRNNNLGEDLCKDNIHFHVLKKIFGKKHYDEYILSGKYIENGLTREKFESFRIKLNNFIYNSQHSDKLNNKNNNEKAYIGIFIAKQSIDLAKWIMQFGVNMKVFWPEGLKNLMLDEVNKLREMYLNEND